MECKERSLEVYNEQLDLPISSISFTKDLKKYCQYKGYDYNEKNAGSVLSFKITDPSKFINTEDDIKEDGGSDE